LCAVLGISLPEPAPPPLLREDLKKRAGVCGG
jgi:hypothetical protein